MTSIHNPKNFDPTQYEIVSYMDTRLPMLSDYLGGEVFGDGVVFSTIPLEVLKRMEEEHRQDVAEKTAQLRALFGNTDYHICAHCGHNPIRWVAVVRYLPDGEGDLDNPDGRYLPFGETCADHRLGLPSRAAFASIFIHTKAALEAKRLLVQAKRIAWEAQNVEVASYLHNINPETHWSSFVVDMYHNLMQWGELSEGQCAGILKTQAAELARQEREQVDGIVKNNAPSGKVTVTAQVVSIKDVEGSYGWQTKMKVALLSPGYENSTAYGTVPASISDDVAVGGIVTFTATFDPTTNDKTHAWFSRPGRKCSYQAQEMATA